MDTIENMLIGFITISFNNKQNPNHHNFCFFLIGYTSDT